MTQLRLKNSIIRKSFLVTGINSIALLFQYLTLIFANKIVDIDTFGVFYAAITVINVAFAPFPFYTLAHSKPLTKLYVTHGVEVTSATFFIFFRQLARFAAKICGLLWLGLMGMAAIMGTDYYLSLFVTAMAIFTHYLYEVVRTGLMAIQRFIYMAFCSVLCLGFRLLFVTIGLYYFQKVTPGLVGIFVAPIVTIVIFLPIFFHHAKSQKAVAFEKSTTEKDTSLSNMMSMSIVTILMYADILTAYIVLDKHAMGAYAASAILPKAIGPLIMPIVQVLFPHLVAQKKDSPEKEHISKAKRGVIVTMLLCSVCVLGLIAGEGFISGDYPFSIAHSLPQLITPIALAMIPVCIIRILIYIKIARGNTQPPLFLCGSVLAYVLFMLVAAPTSEFLATSYMWFCYGILFICSFQALRASRTAKSKQGPC